MAGNHDKKKIEIPLSDLQLAPGSVRSASPVPTMLGMEQCVFTIHSYDLEHLDKATLVKIASLLNIDTSDLVKQKLPESRQKLHERISDFLHKRQYSQDEYPYFKESKGAGDLLINDKDSELLKLTLYRGGQRIAQQYWYDGSLIHEYNDTDYLEIVREYSEDPPHYLEQETINFKMDPWDMSNRTELVRYFEVEGSKAYVYYKINNRMGSKEEYYSTLAQQKQILGRLSKAAASLITNNQIPEIQNIIGAYLIPEL
jgi:hypothetical protein